MTGSSYRKQVLLFLAAVVVPSMALTFLTLQIIFQEKELAEKRLQEERSRRAREIGRVLLDRLEAIRRDEVEQQARCDQPIPCATVCAETRWVALESNDRLVFPWETGPATEPPSEPAVSEWIRKAWKAEFAAKDAAAAADAYRHAMKLTTDSRGRQLLRLSLARSLREAGDLPAAAAMFRDIAALPAEIVDEDGMPLCLDGCDALLDMGIGGQEVTPVLERVYSAPGWRQAFVYYRLRDLAEKIAPESSGSGEPSAAGILGGVQHRIHDIEVAEALRNSFPQVPATQDPGEPAAEPAGWTLVENSWFVAASREPGKSGTVVLAVEVDPLLLELSRSGGPDGTGYGDLEFVAASEGRGEALGPSFSNGRVVLGMSGFAGESGSGGIRGLLYGLTLLLVLGLTMFGGWLLLRDVRREVRLAGLRSQFVAGVTHELKTPLTSIRMFADTLRLGRCKGPEARQEYLDTIVNESERLSRLLNNVLDFSRIEEGRMEYRFSSVAVADVVSAAAKAMSYPLEQQGFTLSTAVEEGLPEITADRDALIQALLNLLHNAMKFSGTSRNIELSAFRSDSGIAIRVTDHGIGIDTAEQRRIFDRFYRIPSPHPERIPGTGLGLTIVDHIVKAHGGAVQVQSAPGRGSSFSISLPPGNGS